MPSTTTRAAIPYPLTSDNNAVATDMQALATQVDSIFAVDKQGLLSARPVAGTRGGWYFATDTGSEHLYRDSGTAYWEIPLLSKSASFGGKVSATNVSNVAFSDNTGHSWETDGSAPHRWRFRNSNLSTTSGFLFTGGTGNTDIAKIDYTGSFLGIGTDHYFGGYAFTSGTSVSRARIHTTATAAYFMAEGDGATRDIVTAVKGSGIWWYQDDLGATKAKLMNDGSLQNLGTDHYIGPYAFSTGTSVSRIHIQLGSGSVNFLAEGDGANRDINLNSKGTGVIYANTAALNVAGNNTGITPFYINAVAGHATNLMAVDINGSAKTRLTNIGQFQTISSGYFGAGVYGAASGFTQVGDDGSGNSYIAAGHGTAANASIVLQPKGTGSHFLRTSGGTNGLVVDNNGGTSLNRASAGISLDITTAASTMDTGSLRIRRPTSAAPTSLVFATGAAYDVILGRNTSSDSLDVGINSGGGYSQVGRITDVNGSLAMKGQAYFGDYALSTGTTVSRLHLQTDGGAAYLTAEGDTANRNLVLRGNGTGSIQVQTGGGVQLGNIDATGIMQFKGSDHYFGRYALNSGTTVSRLHVNDFGTGITLIAEGDGSNQTLNLQSLGTGVVSMFQGATQVVQASTTGLLVLGASSKLGAGSFGAAQAFTQIGDDGGGNALVQAGHGTSLNAGLLYRAKGTGNHVFQNPGGSLNLFQIDPNGHYVGPSGTGTPSVTNVSGIFTGGSASGTDTVGTVTLTGATGGALAQGNRVCTVTFSHAFSGTPRAVILQGQGTNGYLNQTAAISVSTTGFDVYVGSGGLQPGSGQSFAIAYLVIQ